MASDTSLARSLGAIFGDANVVVSDIGEITLTVAADILRDSCITLREDEALQFDMLIDIAVVDYGSYGSEDPEAISSPGGGRFAVVYHLLSVAQNHRLRVRTMLDDEFPAVDSVTEVWTGANWYEREAFDLYGIVFEGHPDLRRLLTDYGFIGHPFRKDFPLSGHVEMRYDADKGRVVYEPVSIEPRVLVPRIIREDGFGDRDT